MKYMLAPMEGITGYVYRNAYHKYFAPMDQYMTPFIPPNQNRCMNARERNDILPEHNEGLFVVPQILTNNATYFIHTTRELMTYGYQQVNLNLGCPSGTVVAKKKGAGFLVNLDALEAFLDEIYTRLDVDISIKTRIGKEDPEEFHDIMKLFGKFPVKELIVHPRIQKDFYKNSCRIDHYIKETRDIALPLYYNGDITDVASYRCTMGKIQETPTQGVMLGRGVIGNPFLLEEIRGFQDTPSEDVCRLRAFMEEVEMGYCQIISGDRNVLFRLKEIWAYLIQMFPDAKKGAKHLKKANNLSDYHTAVEEIYGSKRD